MRPPHPAWLAALLSLPVCPAAALANGYKVEPMMDSGSFQGCLGLNPETGVAFVAAPGRFSVVLQASEFKVASGDKIDGTWAVDDRKQRALSPTANGAGIVSIDLDSSRHSIELFADGDRLTTRIGEASHVFSLADSAAGLAALRACMKAGGAK